MIAGAGAKTNYFFIIWLLDLKNLHIRKKMPYLASFSKMATYQ